MMRGVTKMAGNRRLRSLRTRIIAWFLIPTAIILAVVGLFAFYTYQRVTEELVIERNQAITRLLASQVAVDLTVYAEQLNALAATVSVYPLRTDPLTGKAIIKLAADRLFDFDAGVVIVDDAGMVIAADQRRLDTIGLDWSQRAYFQQAVGATPVEDIGSNLPAPVFSDIVPDGPAGSNAIVVGVPARGLAGEFQGMSAGLFRVDSAMEARSSAFYIAIVRKLRQASSSTIYLLDGNGRAIYHSDPTHIGEDLSAENVVQRALARRSGGIHTRDAEGQEILASFAPVPNTSWVIVTEESWATLIGSSAAYGRLLLALLALGVVVPALVIALGARRITRPIADLTTAVREVAGGRFGQVLVGDDADTVGGSPADGVARGGDELEELARQFNRMSAELAESYATLEQRVADRTRELATLNSIAGLVSRSLDLREILRDALSKTMEAMGMEAGTAHLLAADGESLQLIAQEPCWLQAIQRADCANCWSRSSG
jgi:signal transduction histidine kinase